MINPKNLRKFADRFSGALEYAAKKHATQVRKGTGVPYVSHLLAVASLTLENGGGEVEAIAALLHDTVEDQGGRPTLEEVRRKFGHAVARIVEACSDSEGDPKPPWKARKVAYLAHLRTAPRSVKLVSAADKLHNLRCILADYRVKGDKVWKRFNAPMAEQFWYYRALIAVLRKGGPKALVTDLDRTLNALETLTRKRAPRLRSSR